MPIDYDKIFAGLPEFLNLPVKRKGRRWVLNTYMDLTRHSRRDKLVFVQNSGGGINVIEQGGDTYSLYRWLLLYGNCQTEMEVMDKLTNGGLSLKIEVNNMIRETQTRYVDQKYVDRLCLQDYDPEKPYLYYKENNLYKYLCSVFNEQDVYAAFNKYRVGTIGNKCIFWKSDSKGRWVSDNRIEYMPNGKRNKEKNAFRKFKVDDNFTGKGYFGLSLVEKGDTVCMVESEKTAIIMSIAQPDKKWIACSGMNQIHRCGKNWLLYPDYAPEAIEIWRQKGNVFEWWQSYPSVAHNDDIADVVLRKYVK